MAFNKINQVRAAKHWTLGQPRLSLRRITRHIWRRQMRLSGYFFTAASYAGLRGRAIGEAGEHLDEIVVLVE